MESDTAQRLAGAFPHTFRAEKGYVEFSVGADDVCIEPDGSYRIYSNTYNDACPLILESGQALLHAALRDLCERAGLWLVQDPLWEKQWVVQKGIQPRDGVPIRMRNVSYADTPAEAVLAAADEINKRLEAQSDGE